MLHSGAWSEDENSRLLVLWKAGKTVQVIANTLNRTWESVHQRTRRLGLKRYRRWTPEEDEAIVRLAKDHTHKEIAPLVGRTWLAVRSRLERLGHTSQKRPRWTREELENLKVLAPSMTPRELSARFQRSLDGIYAVLSRNRVEVAPKLQKKPWSVDEDELILELEGVLSAEDIGERLGRTKCAVYYRLRRLKGPVRRLWTTEEEEILLRFHQLESLDELADRLKRTPSSVSHKIRRLQGRENLGAWRKWTKEEDMTLLKWWGYESPEKTAERLDRTLEGTRGRIRKLTGSCDLLRGRTTIKSLAESTGYNEDQIRRAIQKSRVIPHRDILGGKKPWNVLTEQQVNKVLAYLARPARYLSRSGKEQDYWSRKWSDCRCCGCDGTEPEERHYARGLCCRCYWRAKKRNELHLYP